MNKLYLWDDGRVLLSLDEPITADQRHEAMDSIVKWANLTDTARTRVLVLPVPVEVVQVDRDQGVPQSQVVG